MTKALFVPIHLDARIVRQQFTVVQWAADFFKLPYTYTPPGEEAIGPKEYSPETVFSSEAILAHPFENKQLHLPPGIHLHWSLPDTLTRSMRMRIVRKQDFILFFKRAALAGGQVTSTTTSAAQLATIEAEIRLVWEELLNQGWWTRINDEQAFTDSFPAKDEALLEVALSNFSISAEQILAYTSTLREKNFPGVPNRWLVRRKTGRQVDYRLVQSDCLRFLHEEDFINSDDFLGVNYLFHADEAAERPSPFGFLGRKSEKFTDLNQLGRHNQVLVPAAGEQVMYLNYLNATGYGNPSFAAFYPNCYSVFGYYDEEMTPEANPVGNLPDQYMVLGWYEDANTDFLSRVIPEFVQRFQNAGGQESEFMNALERELRWDFYGDPKDLPMRLFCYASLDIQANNLSEVEESEIWRSPIDISVGNTGSEALAAFLAQRIAGADNEEKQLLEDQLEALHLDSQLENRQLDVGQKFKELRHEQGFNAESSGLIWSIASRSPESDRADTTPTDAEAQQSFPPELASELIDKLNRLNDLQYQLNQLRTKIDTVSTQLFSDWYKYMITLYPPATLQVSDKTDEIKFYMEEKGLQFLDSLYQQLDGLLAQIPPLKAEIEGDLKTASNFNLRLFYAPQALDESGLSATDASLAQVDVPAGIIAMDEDLVETQQTPVLTFDGQTQHLPIHGLSYQGGEHNGLTVEAWVKVEPSPNRKVIASFDRDQFWSLEVGGQAEGTLAGQLLFFVNTNHSVRGSSRLRVVSEQAVDDDDWHHVAAVFDQGDVFLYIDGELDQTAKQGIRFGTNSERFGFLGVGSVADQVDGNVQADTFFQGRMTQVRIYQYALHASIIRLDINNAPKPEYLLLEKGAPRYWQPREPVVMLVGDAATPSPRHGRDGCLRKDGLLDCFQLDLVVDTINEASLTQIFDEIERQQRAGDQIGFYQWQHQPWNPFLLEWGNRDVSIE